jgi:hypothetical protein
LPEEGTSFLIRRAGESAGSPWRVSWRLLGVVTHGPNSAAPFATRSSADVRYYGYYGLLQITRITVRCYVLYYSDTCIITIFTIKASKPEPLRRKTPGIPGVLAFSRHYSCAFSESVPLCLLRKTKAPGGRSYVGRTWKTGRLLAEAAVRGARGDAGRQKKMRAGKKKSVLRGSAQVLDKARFGQGKSKLFPWLCLAGLGWIWLNLAQFGWDSDFPWRSSLHICAADLIAAGGPPTAARQSSRRPATERRL